MATPAQAAAALSRRRGRYSVRIEWFENRLRQGLRMGMSARIRLCAQMLRDKAVINISRPVTKTRSERTGRIVVSNRSRPGEFPKADTTRLMKDVYWESRGDMDAIVGTTLDYGLILETRMNRSFLRRTYNEMMPTIRRILVAGRGGGTNFGNQEEPG